MSATATNFNRPVSGWDDPLALLPRTLLRHWEKGQLIYGPQAPGNALYLVIEGRVKVSRMVSVPEKPGQFQEVVLEFCHKDDFFGEAGIFGSEDTGEQAIALEPTALMQWPAGEVARLISRTPALGPALLRVLAQKLVDAGTRIESFCLDPIHRRLAKALLHLARRAGEPNAEGLHHLLPITHEQLAHYVGTSREIITQTMTQLRRDCLLKYSRRGIDVDLKGLEKYLAPAA